MVQVVGKDSSIAKRVTCRKCSNILEFLPVDIKEDYSSDYTGSKGYYKFISCTCGNQVKVN